MRQVTTSSIDSYTDIIVKFATYLRNKYHGKKLYAILKTTIPQAVKAYQMINAKREDNSHFEIWNEYQDREDFVLINFSL